MDRQARERQREIDRDIGTRIAEARLRRGNIKQRAVAIHLGVDRSMISQWETGRRRIPLAVLHQIAGLLKVNPAWLLSGEGPFDLGEQKEVPADLEARLEKLRQDLERQIDQRFAEVAETGETIIHVAGAVSAGPPFEGISLNEQIRIPIGPHIRWIKISGDSMATQDMEEWDLHDGDVIAVDKQAPYMEGELAYLIVGNEQMIRFFSRDDRSAILKPANPSYSPRVITDDEVRIDRVGKVVMMIRTLRARQSDLHRTVHIGTGPRAAPRIIREPSKRMSAIPEVPVLP